ncbi:MAG: 1-acyl-sn-glycerol-3-phosphate acyltransferase [Thermoanaerobaculia bacterium]|nr:1-acyl-sn-glycerol-3-phosphate acyltransferase [Thermoanaerobaculia bacterium]
MTRSTLIDLLWLPLNALQLLATMVWSAFWISIALVVALASRRREPALWLARHVWAPGMVAIGLSRLSVVGRERLDFRRSYFFAANHQSWLDIPVLFAAVPAPLHFLAKQELARVPFLGWYIAAMGMVFVDRGDRRKAVASVDRASALLAAGGSLVSFPEGRRSAPGELGRFKSGGFAAVLDSGVRDVDVVPVAIVGAGRILPRDGFKVRPGKVEVRFGAPIPVAGLVPADRADLARRAEEAVAALLGLPAAARPTAPRGENGLVSTPTQGEMR